jgi:hypothetical protein
MVRDLDILKTSPEAVSRGIFDGVERERGRDLPRPDVRDDGGKLGH